jgi:flagellar basal-body rod protein FlgB
MMSGLESTIQFLHRGLDVANLRNDVISNNIANAEVPHFKRSKVTFESELNRALENANQPALAMTTSDPRHFTNVPSETWQDVTPRRVVDFDTTAKPNGNNVDMEQEVQNSVKNQLMYKMLTQSINFEFAQVASALRV